MISNLESGKEYWFTYIWANNSKNCGNVFSTIKVQKPVKVVTKFSKGSYSCNIVDKSSNFYYYHPKYWRFDTYTSSICYVGNFLFNTKEEAIEYYNKEIALEKEKVKEIQRRKLNYLDNLII